MNKYMGRWAILAVFALASVLTACGSGHPVEGVSAQGKEAETSVSQAAQPTETQTKQVPEAADLSADQLLEQAIAAGHEVSSYRLRTDREEHIAVSQDSEPDGHYIIETNLTMNPLTAYRELNMHEAGRSEQEEPLKRYLDEQAVYSAYRESDWVREPEEDLPASLAHLRQAADLSGHLQNLQEAAGEHRVTEQNGNLLLTVVLEGDDNREIAEQYMQQSDDFLPHMQADISRWKVERLTVSYEFDRSSLLPVTSTAEFELVRPEDAELHPRMKNNFAVKAEYSDYNEVETIKIPAEVEEQASGSGS
ncbi:DUF6612 family protein [Saccharibacillus kuerlensis]|uniref:Lipoprotein n=1 Tax=Saccharibacillus kuerlensis TaxID=459527 RepID=A0ABQ2L4Y0_9BACL|nr:DUF6612 family protein [Saccharibacillus kuerlensis]GGO03659.1 hypothetical protein GCM10010969_28030 [Saccharibacillus kuerlensis]